MKDMKIAVRLLLLLTLLTGGLYPAAVTVIAGRLFPEQAQGSLIVDDRGKIIGSRLVGQPFAGERYFWSRPSATAGSSHNPLASGGSNLGATNPALLDQVGERVKALRHSGVSEGIPVDLVTASASGLDPHISPEAANLQIHRVASARGMNEDLMKDLVAQHREDRQLGVLGMPRVNVLALNLALDGKQP
jgi:potassium-transporting ATPase KdpC subunit